MTTDQTIEQEIKAKGLTAPRVTPADIEANIASEHYFTAGDGYCGALTITPEFSQSGEDLSTLLVAPPESLDLLTFCVLILRNGFTVHGASGVASPENFDAEIVRKVARANAVREIWPLMGYALKQKLAGEA